MIFSTTDPLDRRVTLKQTTWEYKVCNYYNTNDDRKHGNSHPEMESLLPEVRKSIEQPQFIIQDTKIVTTEDGEEIEVVNENREEYIRMYFNSGTGELNSIKTIVEYDDKSNGDIVTTHRITGRIKSIKKGGGNIIYDSTEK